MPSNSSGSMSNRAASKVLALAMTTALVLSPLSAHTPGTLYPYYCSRLTSLVYLVTSRCPAKPYHYGGRELLPNVAAPLPGGSLLC